MKVISTKSYENFAEDEFVSGTVPITGGNYNLKIYTLKKGQKFPLHYHKSEHSEHFYYVKSGTGVITVGENTKKVVEGEAVYIPSKEMHAIVAPYGDFVIISISPRGLPRVYVKDLPRGRHKGSGKWRCTICGYIVKSKTPPSKCGICGRPREDLDEI